MSAAADVAVVGGGVVGCAVAHALARRGVRSLVLEAEPGLALGASGTSSGILHTGFDSTPGELETRLILRAARLRERLLGELGVPVLRCGALLAPHEEGERAAVAALAANAARNGVEATVQQDGSLLVPGEAVTDPVAYVYALAAAACAGGAQVRANARVVGLGPAEGGRGAGSSGAGASRGESAGGGADAHARIAVELGGGERVAARAVVNCAGLFADEVAALAGDAPASIYPRKGEFVVFEAPAPAARILLPVPGAMGKGVLVFPGIDGVTIAGPTAREREDKEDWSVEEGAAAEIRERGARMYPPLAGAEPIAAYAGLRPAGRDGANYVIEPSAALPGVVHVAAIRSTGLSASPAIGEHVAELLAEHAGVELGAERPLPVAPTDAARLPGAPRPGEPWWRRAARHRAAAR